jgi:hypothetical protein
MDKLLRTKSSSLYVDGFKWHQQKKIKVRDPDEEGVDSEEETGI